jgi:hypothetical protein
LFFSFYEKRIFPEIHEIKKKIPENAKKFRETVIKMENNRRFRKKIRIFPEKPDFAEKNKEKARSCRAQK